MKAMDEFGSVLTMAALVLGICAVVDEIYPATAATAAIATTPAAFAGAEPARSEYGAQKPVAVARVAPAGPRRLPLPQQVRL